MTEDKLKLWTAIFTFFGVIAGFGVTASQLFSQSKDLQNIEHNFRNLTDLRKALRTPLEGLWDYHVEFTKYFGTTTPHRKVSGGVAVFLWNDGPTPGYEFYVGGGIQEHGKEGQPIVTYVIRYFLQTDSLGNPTPGLSAHGAYKARTSSDPTFSISGDPDLELYDGKFDRSATNTISKMTFKYHRDINDPAHKINCRGNIHTVIALVGQSHAWQKALSCVRRARSVCDPWLRKYIIEIRLCEPNYTMREIRFRR